jgi:hypothetical protein
MPGGPDAEWIPRPRKDIDYDFHDLPAEAERIRRKLSRTSWPARRPTQQQAQIGDVLAGNVELHAGCACGHYAKVEPAVLAAKYAPSTRIEDIRRRVRCTQCRRYGTATMAYPDQR